MTLQKTAAILAIGDELLSGRTRESNMHYLAGWLTERGVALKEARVVGDDLRDICGALNALRTQYDYVFTSGGIGPTHDDITIDAIAAAMNIKVVEHPQAVEMITAHYSSRDIDITPSRLRMARTPEGAALIENPASGAPGIRIQNIFVLAGVPRIFQVMLSALDGEIERGAVMHSRSISIQNLPESMLADQLRDIQAAQSGVSIGSYPIDGDIKGVSIVARSQDAVAAEEAIAAVRTVVGAMGYSMKINDL